MNLALCDDQELFRAGLKKLLETEPGYQVTIDVSGGQELINALEQGTEVDVLLLDVRMEPMDGVETCIAAHRLRPALAILMLTTFDSDEYVFDALKAGARGYVLKDTSAEALFSAIGAAAAGQATFSAPIAGKFMQNSSEPANSTPRAKSPLSQRELQILHLVAQGLSNKEIGTRLFLAQGTVKNHITNILVKINAKDRAHAVALALQKGYLAINQD